MSRSPRSACRCTAAWASSRRRARRKSLRDARIASIYEGTNGIQAIDLVTRKLPMSGRRGRARLHRRAAGTSPSGRAPRTGRISGAWANACLPRSTIVQETSEHLLGLLRAGKTAEALAGAAPYLRQFGLAAGGAYLAKAALASLPDGSSQPGQRVAHRTPLLRRAAGCRRPRRSRLAVTEGAEAVLAALRSEASTGCA